MHELMRRSRAPERTTTSPAARPEQVASDAMSSGVTPGTGFDFGSIAIFPPQVSRVPGDSGPDPDPDLAQRIWAASGGGSGLEERSRTSLGHGLGADLSGVRIHTDTEADQLARSVDARAFTSGQDIFFRAGSYDPESRAGQHLIAHEAAHTVQQAAGPVAGAATAGGVTISDPTDSFEQAAEAAADAAVPESGGQRAASTSVQRTLNDGSAPPPDAATPHLGAAHAVDASGNLLIQRAPPQQDAPAPAAQNMQRELDIQKKKTEVLRIDAKWHGAFNERIASYEAAILRITGGLDKAAQGFQAAQVAQAQFDQLKVQLIGGLLAVGFAAGFEWAMGSALGALGKKLSWNAQKIESVTKSVTEAVENPANAAVSGTVNVVATQTAKADADAGQVPAVSGGSVQFLSTNQQAIKLKVQEFEAAYVKRADDMKAMTDEEWEKLDTTKLDSQYERMLNDLKTNFSGVEEMKPDAEVAMILERHLWALWLQGQGQAELKEKQEALNSGDQRRQAAAMGNEPAYSVGSYVEDELNKVGIGGPRTATVLTGHWYSANEPGNWRQLLLDWAKGYNETLKLK